MNYIGTFRVIRSSNAFGQFCEAVQVEFSTPDHSYEEFSRATDMLLGYGLALVEVQ